MDLNACCRRPVPPPNPVAPLDALDPTTQVKQDADSKGKNPLARMCGGSMVSKDILCSLSGVLEPARFTAVMGASGAGKTTFLNVLVRARSGGTRAAA